MKRSGVSLAPFIIISFCLLCLSIGASGFAQEIRDADEQGASSGADASNPTAAVNFQDLRYRYFNLDGSRDKHSFETEGSYMIAPNIKLTNELRYVSTDASGDWKSDFDEVKFKGIYLVDSKPFGIKAKYAIGLEWIKSLGDFEDGTTSGADQFAPLAGVGWIPTETDFIITLVQYFHSYHTDDGAPKVRKTGPRLIYIRKIPSIRGWFKSDLKGVIDHEDGDDFSATLELQLGKMFTPRFGMYGEVFLGDDLLDSNAYDSALGIGLRFMY